MAPRGAGNGLMLAGAIVTIVGLTVAMMHMLHVPGYWITVAVGIAMLAGGAIRALARRPA